MARKPYRPSASYSELKRVEQVIDQTHTVDELRQVVYKDGPKIGYKAFCYILGGRMTPEAMKPDEACTAGFMLEGQGKTDEAMTIYKKVVKVHADHPIAKVKVAGG